MILKVFYLRQLVFTVSTHTHKLFTTKVTNHLKVAAFRCGDASGMQLSQPPNLLPEKLFFFMDFFCGVFFVVFQPITSRVLPKFCPSFLRYFFLFEKRFGAVEKWLELIPKSDPKGEEPAPSTEEARPAPPQVWMWDDVGKRLNYALFKWHYIMNNYCIQKKIYPDNMFIFT